MVWFLVWQPLRSPSRFRTIRLKKFAPLSQPEQAASISAFVKHAVGVALFDAAGWREMLEDALRQTGGPLTKKERAWADALLSPQGQKRGSREREGRVSGITFDAGGLIALDRNDRRVLALLARAAERGMRITIPATALAQAIRNPARQARLSRLIRQAGHGPHCARRTGRNGCRPFVGTNGHGRHRRCPRRRLCPEGRAGRRDQRRRRSQANRPRAAIGGRVSGRLQATVTAWRKSSAPSCNWRVRRRRAAGQRCGSCCPCIWRIESYSCSPIQTSSSVESVSR